MKLKLGDRVRFGGRWGFNTIAQLSGTRARSSCSELILALSLLTPKSVSESSLSARSELSPPWTRKPGTVWQIAARTLWRESGEVIYGENLARHQSMHINLTRTLKHVRILTRPHILPPRKNTSTTQGFLRKKHSLHHLTEKTRLTELN